MRSRPRAATRRAARALAASGTLLALMVLAGCSRSTTAMEERVEPEAVVVYSAQLLSEHPLYPQVTELSARITGVTAPPDLRAARALLKDPLRERLLSPPRVEEASFASLTGWEARADAALAARVQEAEESLGQWPEPEIERTRARIDRETAEAVREAQNRAEVEQMRVAIAQIERHQDEFEHLRQVALSEDRAEATEAVDRQAALWRGIEAETEAVRREAEAKLRELRAASETEREEALAAARDRAEAERAAHLEALRTAGDEVRGRLAGRVGPATATVRPAENAQQVPSPPDTSDLAALLGEVDAAQRKARERRLSGLVATRGRLLREIALSTQNAVMAVGIRNGLDVRAEQDQQQGLRDATEELRPLLREYWAARPAIAGTEP